MLGGILFVALYGAVIGRYRLPLVAVLLVEAAFGAGRIAAWWRAREWRRATLATLAAVAIAVVSAAIPPGAGHARYRGAEFLVNANAYYERGDGDRALAELRDGVDEVCAPSASTRLPPDCMDWIVQPFLRMGHALGRDAEIAARLEELVVRYPADAPLHHWLGVLYDRGLNQPADAARHYEAATR